MDYRRDATRNLIIQPLRRWEFVSLVRERFEETARAEESPALLTSLIVQPFVRQIVERFRLQTPVLSQSEIRPGVRLKTVAKV